MSNHTEAQIDQAETSALAGNVVASNATEYGLYTTSNGIGTELRTEQGDPALTRTEYGMWQVQPGYQDVIKETGFSSIHNIGELRLALDRLKVLTEFKPVILHAQPEQNS